MGEELMQCLKCQSCGKALIEGDQCVLFKGKDDTVVVCTECASDTVENNSTPSEN